MSKQATLKDVVGLNAAMYTSMRKIELDSPNARTVAAIIATSPATRDAVLLLVAEATFEATNFFLGKDTLSSIQSREMADMMLGDHEGRAEVEAVIELYRQQNASNPGCIDAARCDAINALMDLYPDDATLEIKLADGSDRLPQSCCNECPCPTELVEDDDVIDAETVADAVVAGGSAK